MLRGGPPWGAETRTGATIQQADALLTELCRTQSDLRRTLWDTLHPLNYAVPFGYAAPSELRLTLLSNATPFELRTPFWATPHPTGLRRTQLCYAASSELCRNLLSYATPIPTELLSY